VASAASLLQCLVKDIENLAPKHPASAFPHMTLTPFEDAQELNSTHNQPLIQQTTVVSEATAACSSNQNVRIEWRSYPEADRLQFIGAIKCLMSHPPSGGFPPATNRYDDLARLHQEYTPNIHNNAKFLIWHRYFLWTFEQVLRAECGFTALMPWWDETLDAGAFAKSDMFTNTEYFGHMPTANNGNPVCIVSGAFAGLTCHIGPGSGNTPHCLARAVDESLTAQCSTGYINLCNSRTSYADFESCLEDGPHGYGHDGIGAVMADVSGSPSDPIFWMHHTFVDHAFRIWQNGDISTRTSSVNGNDATGAALTMDTVVAMGNIRPNIKVGDIMNTLGGTVIGGETFCYRYSY